MKFQQKSWMYHRNFELKSDGVEIDFKTNDGIFIQTVKFEDIEFEEQIYEKKPSAIKIGLAVSVVVNIILFILFIGDKFMDLNSPMNYQTMITIPVVLSIFGKFYLKTEKLKYLVGKKNLSFLYNDKYKNDVDSYILEIKKAKRNYIREKYLKIDETEDSFIFKNILKWLKVENYIDENEYKDWLNQIDNRMVVKGF